MKTSLIVKHDYLTLRITQENKTSVSIGFNRSGAKASGTIRSDEEKKLIVKTVNFFFPYLERREKNETYLEILKDIEQHAKTSASLEALIVELS